jgi:hypothetical protein
MASYLDGLPDELILEIYKHLRPARKYGQDDNGRDKYGGGINPEQPLVTFASLCLTSKHLGKIANPELYASIRNRDGPRKNILRRIFGFLDAIIRKPLLGHQVSYIEHQFDWCDKSELYKTYITGYDWSIHYKALKLAASNVWDAELLSFWDELLMTHPEQAQLVLLLAQAPNVSHIVIDIFDRTFPTFASLLNLDPNIITQHRSGVHRFERLERVTYYSRDDWYFEVRPFSFERYITILRSLQSFPALRHYQHEVAISDSIYSPAIYPPFQLERLETLEFINCHLNMSIVAAAVRGCSNLKRFNLWVIREAEFYDFSELYTALQTVMKTIEYI